MTSSVHCDFAIQEEDDILEGPRRETTLRMLLAEEGTFPNKPILLSFFSFSIISLVNLFISHASLAWI